MSDTSQDSPVQFGARGFVVHEFNLISGPRTENEFPDPQLKVGVQFITAENSEDIDVRMVIELADSKSKPKHAARLMISGLFFVEGMQRFHFEEGTYKLPSDLMASIASVVYSTSRGYLMGRGAGTFLELHPLPLIDPHVLLTPEKPAEEVGQAEPV